MPGERVDIELVEVGRRLRDASPVTIEALAQSIREVGLLHPLTVYRRQIIRGASSVEGYGLISGANRLEACRSIGMKEIDVNVVDLSELERQIAECDENLLGPTLTPSDRAMFTRRRKEAYEALHPEAKLGATGVGRDKVRQVGEANDPADRFTADTAKATGQSERSVQRDAERGEKVSEEALALVKGTALDTGVYLDKLKRVARDDQVAQVKKDMESPPSGPLDAVKTAVVEQSERMRQRLVSPTGSPASSEFTVNEHRQTRSLAPLPAAEMPPSPAQSETNQGIVFAGLIDLWVRADDETRRRFLIYVDHREAPESI